ncbi:MAG TPA: crossover junction endodeoxyribonuclease RuvC [Polyangiaceae bacterium]|nr:crossover junction endodeoxyribonuclease RuvC [Polyangiaceae bacterium]
MRILGIDPGTLHLGWGVVQAQGNRLRHVAHGVIDLDPKATLPARLVVIERGLIDIIEEHAPNAGSVESLFFHRDAQAAAKLGHARGVVLLSLARAGLEVFEYPPTRVKLTVTGRGQAEKSQVAFMMRTLLALDGLPRADAADALAVAVTHLRRAPIDAVLTPSSSSSANGRLHGFGGPSRRKASAAVKARVLALAGGSK